MAYKDWNSEQLTVALNLYWKIPYNKISGSSNLKIKETAEIIGRSPGALAYKLMNFTSLDPEKQKTGNKGKHGASKADKIIWDKYYNKWEELAIDSYEVLSKMKANFLEENIFFEEEIFSQGLEKKQIVNIRINQADFRQRILASYNEKCCITGLNIKSLLVASHIVPWSKNDSERLNPRNGLCLNSIHDKAFDTGLLTITSDFKIKLSKEILNVFNHDVVQDIFIKYENKQIFLPERYLPSKDFLDYHNNNIFII